MKESDFWNCQWILFVKYVQKSETIRASHYACFLYGARVPGCSSSSLFSRFETLSLMDFPQYGEMAGGKKNFLQAKMSLRKRIIILHDWTEPIIRKGSTNWACVGRKVETILKNKRDLRNFPQTFKPHSSEGVCFSTVRLKYGFERPHC